MTGLEASVRLAKINERVLALGHAEGALAGSNNNTQERSILREIAKELVIEKKELEEKLNKVSL